MKKGQSKLSYTVRNVYGIGGESHHHTAKAAIKKAKSREGEGWEVFNSAGRKVWEDFDGKVYEEK